MRRSTCGLLLCLLIGCSSRDEAKPAAEPPAPAAAAPAPAPVDPAKAEADRKARAEAALARIPAIKTRLAEVRGLPFERDVPAVYQAPADFRAFVKRELARELDPARARAMVAAYVQIGLLKESIDLVKTLEDALVSQAGAYYDPEKQTYYLVMVPPMDTMLDAITAHELTHALQDQHFDLDRYYPRDAAGRPSLEEDAMNARRFVVEGDATFTMTAYMASAMGGVAALAPEVLSAMEFQIGMMTKMDIEQLKLMNKQQSESMELGAEIKASVEAMDTIPLIVLVPLLEAYTRGALPVLHAYRAGGWDAVARLYRDPPQSTEQVLHPAEKLFPKRDLPRAVRLPTPKGTKVVFSETMGELGWRVYFMLWSKEVADAAAAGWDGDRFAVVEGEGGKLTGLLATTWDSPAEAEEFERAYRASLVARFGGEGTARPDGTKVAIERKGRHVFVVDGAADDAALKALVRGTKIK